LEDGSSIEYANKYSFPDDFLRLIAYDGSNQELIGRTDFKPSYAIQAPYILTDATVCKIKYVGDLEVVAAMSPLFIDCLVLDLAVRLTKVFNDSSTYLQQLEQDFNVAFAKAKIEDCRQIPLKPIMSYPLLEESRLF
jgi:hypothetical protein